MKKNLRLLATVVIFGLLLGGCGKTNTDMDGMNASSRGTSDESNSGDTLGNLFGNSWKYADKNVGDTIKFGRYEQDNDTENGPEEIEWLVLKKENNKILVISKYALDCQQYNAEYGDITWEICTLRRWLNDSFYNVAFNGEEQAKIVSVTNGNPDSNEFYKSEYAIYIYSERGMIKEEVVKNMGAPGGNDTVDNIFCLSYKEAFEYFASDETRRCTPTAYAMAQGAYAKAPKNENVVRCAWWLRSPANDTYNAMSVNNAGEVYFQLCVCDDYIAVRPALWVSVN